jgi:hypothetical protein
MVPTSFSLTRTPVSLLLVKRPSWIDSYEAWRSLHLNEAGRRAALTRVRQSRRSEAGADPSPVLRVEA